MAALFNTDTYVWVADEYQSYIPAQVMNTFKQGEAGEFSSVEKSIPVVPFGLRC